MSKAAYWQRGETLDYKNEGVLTVEANTVIVFGKHLGIAGTDIMPGETGSIHVTGVFEMPKTASGAIEAGTDVYFDGSGITDTESDNTVLAGYVVEAAATNSETVLVKLRG